MTAAPHVTDWKGCAVCGRVLERQDGRWFHGRQEDRDDHVAVPVPLEQLRVQYRCDVCDRPDVTHLAPCREFLLPTINWRNVGGLMLDGPCAALVAERDLRALLDRVRTGRPDLWDPTDTQVWRMIVGTLLRHVDGPVERLPATRP